MKKETKRYYLVEYLGSKTKRLSSVCEYEKMLKDISSVSYTHLRAHET